MRGESKRTTWLLLASAIAWGAGSACHHHHGTGSTTSGGEADGGVTETTDASSATSSSTSSSSTRPSHDEDEATPPRPSDAGAPNAANSIDAGTVPSPWGATQAEQCAQRPRPPMTRTARSALSEGIAAAQRGDNQTAISRFQRALQDDSNAYRAAYNLGVMYDRAGQESQALDFYRQALRIVPDYEDAVEGILTINFRHNRDQDALNLVAPLAQQFPANKMLQVLQARALVELGRFDDAWAAGRRALACDERYAPALVVLVRASLGQHRKDLAESILDQAIQNDANNAEAHYLRGSMLDDEAGRHREALDEYQRAVSLRSDFVEARLALGIALLNSGNYDAAVQQLQAAAQLAPTLAAIHLNLGDALRSQQQWDRARQELEAALRIDQTLAQAHFDLALLFQAGAGQIQGMDELQALQRAVQEFNTYRTMMGTRLTPDDPSTTYLQSLDRQIHRIMTRREREARAAAAGGGGGDSSGQ